MLLIKNKRASFDYEIGQKLTAGIVLTGAEVKSLRLKMGSLTGAYVQVVDGEAVLLNALINPYKFADNTDYDPKRTRQLLLHKKEIYHLAGEVASKHFTLVPLAIIAEGSKIKLEIGVGRGRRQYEKREKNRQRDLQREQTALNFR